MAIRTVGLLLAGAAVVAALAYGASRFEPTADYVRAAFGFEPGFPMSPAREPAPAKAAAAKTEGESDDDEKKDEDQLPLKPERTATFELSEGTWISLDVSPDGRTILFELLGDVYTVPIAGGAATPLLAGMAFEGQPSYSPDGSMIAFISDRSGAENLWIAKADGSDPKMLSGGDGNVMASPAWSPDGDYVYVSKSSWALGTFELWMHHRNGGGGIQLTAATHGPFTPNDQRQNVLGAAPSADGRYIYYASKSGGFGYNVRLPLWSIHRRDLEEGSEDVVVTAQGSAMRPMISPDGRSLVYATRHEGETGLRLRDLQTGEDRWLIYPVTRDDQESRATRDLMPDASFTPDGRSIVMNLDGGIKRVDVETGAAADIPFTVEATLDIGPDLKFEQKVETGDIKARILQSVSESPNTPRYAFSALGELYVHDVVSGETTKLAEAGRSAFHPSWSPDGRSLTYITWSPEGGDVWRISPSGGAPTRVSRSSAFYSNPAFTPDGREIVALRASNVSYLAREFDFGPTPGMDLVRLPSGGGAARLIAPAAGFGAPHFVGAEERVYVYTGGGLLSMRLDGTDRRTHVQVQAGLAMWDETPQPADDVRLSPDGQHVLALVANQLYVTLAPRFDRGGPTINVTGPILPLKRLSDIGADYFGWSANGDAFYWAVGSTIHRMRLADVAFVEPKAEEEAEASDDSEATDGDDAAEATTDDEGAEGEDGEEAKEEEKEVDSEDLDAWEPELLEQKNEAIATYEVEITVPRDTPTGSILLTSAKVATMGEAGVLESADILIEGSKIAAIGAPGTIDAPAGAKVVDVAGKVITPGFIDTHAHWFEIRRGVIEKDHWGFLANVAYGVTAGLDVQTATNDMFAYQDMIDSGRMIGLRAFSTGPGVFSNNLFGSKDQAYGVLKRYRDHYRTRNIKAYVSGNRVQRQYVVQASRKLGMMPTTEGALDLELDMTHAIDGFWGNEHSLPITPLYDDVVSLFAQTGIAYTPTLLVTYGGPWAENYFYANENPHDDAKLRRFTPHDVIDGKTTRGEWFLDQEHAYTRIAADAAKIARAGGRVGVGSHGQLQGLGYHWELWALASGGLSPIEALEAATISGARIIGYDSEIGSIEVGKYADLNVFDEDPTSDIRNTISISMVMQNGRLYEAETLAQIAPTPTPASDLWFRDEGPEPR